jgi:hypothetical protein
MLLVGFELRKSNAALSTKRAGGIADFSMGLKRRAPRQGDLKEQRFATPLVLKHLVHYEPHATNADVNDSQADAHNTVAQLNANIVVNSRTDSDVGTPFVHMAKDYRIVAPGREPLF